MITKRTEFGKIEILPDGQVQLREDTVYLDDGVVVAHIYHRSVLEPVDNPSHADPRLDAILKVIWTREVVDAHNRAKQEREL